MIIRILIVFCFSVTVYSVEAQIKVSDILKSSLTDIKVQQSKSLIEKSESLKFNSPWIKSVEGRLGITGSALNDSIYGYLRNEDNYGLILQMNNFKEIRKQKEYKSALVGTYQESYERDIETALRIRYKDLTEYYFGLQSIRVLTDLEKLLVQKQNLLKHQAQSGLELKIKEVIETDESKFKLSKELTQMKYGAQLSELKLKEYIGKKDAIQMDTSEFISVEQIKFKLNIIWSNEFEIKEEDFFKSKINLAEAKLSYVKSQNRNVFSDFRVAYDDPLYLTYPNKFKPLNNISFRIGLNLPISGNTNFKRSEAILELKLEEFSAQRMYVSKLNKLSELKIRINELLETYSLINDQKQNGLVNYLIKDPSTQGRIEPLDWIELQIKANELHSQWIKASFEITKIYLEICAAINSNKKHSPVNYLDSNWNVWDN
ncbi:MAG: hypothetical protein ABI851_15590 [Saprospiraceae bacterium]